MDISNEVQAASVWPVPGGAPPEGSVAWVVGVGARAGTGAAIARRMAKGKLHVVVTGRTRSKLDLVVKEIEAAGGSASAAVGSASSEDGLADALAHIDSLDGLAVAVYNAGGSQWRPSILDMDAAFFEDVWRTNCYGAFLVGREAVARMIGRGGAVLFTGSISGILARPKLAAYASAKFGQRAVAQAMAREFGPRNIHIANVIVHGAIDGDRLNNAFPDAKQRRPVDSMVDIDAIAEAYWQVLMQPRTAWTHEMDLRPYCEPF
ncbi:MAG: SDR family NAD(P)-dependent oxidoreductase [Frankia sp.]